MATPKKQSTWHVVSKSAPPPPPGTKLSLFYGWEMELVAVTPLHSLPIFVGGVLKALHEANLIAWGHGAMAARPARRAPAERFSAGTGPKLPLTIQKK